MDISNPFGFVAGRWAFATADTAGDPDRAPDYVPASGATITFTPETPRQVVPDSPGWTGVINKRVVGKLNEDGRLVDAEGHNHFALGVGTYAVHYYFGNGIKWPSHRIQVTEAHTASNPLWLPPMPAPPPVPGAVNRTIQVPADGTDGQVLVWDGGEFSWDFPPEGPRGPKGDLDAEQLAGAPRLRNRVHDITWIAGADATIDSQTPRLAKFTATAQNASIRWTDTMIANRVYYASAEVKSTSDQVYFGSSYIPIYHSGSGDWQRLTGRFTLPGGYFYQVRDNRSSGWDQIEVRDPVLIDLTAVFGAGREPTKEYMDALLAKHGNYIGGVDQFGFGDALQALTIDAKQLAGTPRVVNLALGREYATTGYHHRYKDSPIGIAEGDIVYTHRLYSPSEGENHSVTGAIAILDSNGIHTYLINAWRSHAHANRFIKSSRVQITSPLSGNPSIGFYGENPVAPALFSDINIINLTEVYGAGNEPSQEYMDALVEKHGGYIDGEQYVVGDALHAQTLAGQGMSLRHDNSVGERVFLDHPGGSTMLYGDTGWRDLRGSLLNGWTATLAVKIRRVNNIVTLVMASGSLALNGSAATSDIFLSLPDGFGPDTGGNYGSVGVVVENQADIVEVRKDRSSLVIPSRGRIVGTVVYPALGAWPTTLPGIPQ